jgi:hypothetical protein
MSASALPPIVLLDRSCVVCSHSSHAARDFLAGTTEAHAFVGEVCFGCPDCGRLFGLVGDVLTPPTLEEEPHEA